jgi:hypothetical protein
MRFKSKGVLVALVAVLALSAVVAASASASTPELVNKEGKELVKKHFTGKVPGGTLYTENHGYDSFCKQGGPTEEGTTSGEMTSKTKGTITFTLTSDCIYNGERCRTPKDGLTLIMTVPVELVHTGPKEDALRYLFSSGVPLQCGGFDAKFYGSYLIPVSTKKLAKKYTLSASPAGYRASPNSYENEKGEKVNVQLEFAPFSEPIYGIERVGWQYIEELTFEEEAEFR